MTTLYNGDVIVLKHQVTNACSEPLTVKVGSLAGSFHFTCKTTTNANLRINESGEVDRRGGHGPYATWYIEPHSSSDGDKAITSLISLYPLAHRGKTNEAGGKNWYLGYEGEKWVGKSGNDASGQFVIEKQESAIQLPPSVPYVDPLSLEQKKHFIEKGYLVVKGVVPQDMVQSALRKINHAMGSAQYNTQGEKVEFSDSVRSSMELTVPFTNTACCNIAQSLLGEKNIIHPSQAQIALRYPSYHPEHTNIRWHVDGIAPMAEGKFYPFSLLVGVALSDQNQPGQGNLRVFPGSHYKIAGPYKAAALQNQCLDTSSVSIGSEEHVLLEPGDVVVAHTLLGHGVGKVLTPNIRYQLFYRIRTPEHTTLGTALLDDLFLEYKGLHSIIAEKYS